MYRMCLKNKLKNIFLLAQFTSTVLKAFKVSNNLIIQKNIKKEENFLHFLRFGTVRGPGSSNNNGLKKLFVRPKEKIGVFRL